MTLRRLANCSMPRGSAGGLAQAMRTQMGGSGGGQAGPDRSGATMSTNPGQFEKSFERVIGTIQERHPFQVVKGNPYDVQFGELGFLSKQEKAKDMAEGKETEGAREALRNRLVGEPAMTPDNMKADPMQKLARERIREKLDPRILKESREAPEFYYENQSPMAARFDMFKSSGLFALSIFVVYMICWSYYRNDMSCVEDPPVDYYVSAYKKKKEQEAAGKAAAEVAELLSLQPNTEAAQQR